MKKLLVTIDFSRAAAAAVGEAARRFPHAELYLLHAIDPRFGAAVADATGLDADEVQDKTYSRADAALNDAASRLRDEGRAAHALLVEGDPVEATLEHARRHDAELIVIGCDPSDPRQVELRVQLVRALDRPVLVLPIPD
jgi:nucleotide-binding universal stress UspA family protein